MDSWAVYSASKSDRGGFGCLSCQHIGRPVRVSTGQFGGRKDSQTGLCPIPSPKILLNRPGRFARRPDTRFGRQANRSEHIYCCNVLPSRFQIVFQIYLLHILAGLDWLASKCFFFPLVILHFQPFVFFYCFLFTFNLCTFWKVKIKWSLLLSHVPSHRVDFLLKVIICHLIFSVCLTPHPLVAAATPSSCCCDTLQLLLRHPPVAAAIPTPLLSLNYHVYSYVLKC